jgi:hypothetical protein
MADKAALGRTIPALDGCCAYRVSFRNCVVEGFDTTAPVSDKSNVSALFPEDITLTVPILTISR